LKIDAHCHQIKYLVDKVHPLDNQHLLNGKKKWIIEIILVTTTLAGLFKMIKK